MTIQADEILLISWFFIIGAAIGSFLNVVVYRLPNKLSLVDPPSHCPKCKHRVRCRDNIPILSWFLLGGKCRDCHTPISKRYPLVELVTALTFALLTMVEFTFKGVNLPMAAVNENQTVTIINQNNMEFYGILLYHLLFLCTLLCAGLIEYDQKRPSWKLFAPALLIGVVTPFFWPFLHPAPAWPGLEGIFGRAVNHAAGLIIGGALLYIVLHIQKSEAAGGLAWGLLATSVFLGWQAACGLAALTALLGLIGLAFRTVKKKNKTMPLCLWLFVAATGWILCWANIAALIENIIGLST